jgi:glycosyltransferase involved in cell wall biosynthesis
VDRRILFVSATLGLGGAERQWAALIPALRARGFRSSALTLYEGGPLARELQRDGVATESVGMNGRSDLRPLVRHLARPIADELVVSQSFAGNVVAQALARRARVPHVVCEHHGIGLARPMHERAALCIVSPIVSAVVAVSPSQLADLVQLGYRRERIRVIPNGVAPLVAERRAAQVREELGVRAGAFVAVLAATLRPEKRAHLFVEAVARANAVDDRVVGLVAGAGPELPRVEALARTTGGAVRVLGNRSDIVDVVSAADVSCLTSETEALPMVLLEAMALGKPVVAIDVGGVRDAVEDGETGLLVRSDDPAEFADSLLRLANDRAFAARLGARGRERQIARFSAARMVEDYARLFESVAARPSRPIA